MGAAIIGMELAALIVAVLAFGWPVLLVGAPLFVATLAALAVIQLWEPVRRRIEQRRSARWAERVPAVAAPPQAGLMSGFFEVAAVGEQPPLPRVEVPMLNEARGWARRQLSESGITETRPVQRVVAISTRLPEQVRELRRSGR